MKRKMKILSAVIILFATATIILSGCGSIDLLSSNSLVKVRCSEHKQIISEPNKVQEQKNMTCKNSNKPSAEIMVPVQPVLINKPTVQKMEKAALLDLRVHKSTAKKIKRSVSEQITTIYEYKSASRKQFSDDKTQSKVDTAEPILILMLLLVLGVVIFALMDTNPPRWFMNFFYWV